MKTILLFLSAILFSFNSFSQWDHRTYRAISTDGLNWTRDTALLFYPASVPKAVVDTNNIVFIYYIYMANQSSKEKIMVATSTDGKNFSSPQEITITNNVTLNRFDPKPVLLKDGRIRIYYVDATLLPPHDVYSAVSTDGINFTEESGKRFTYSELTDPDVFIVDSTWVLFAPSPKGMVRAISKDEGVTFNEDTTFTWPSATVFGTYKFDTLYRTFYCDNGNIASAMSLDGFNLNSEAGTRLTALANEMLCDPSVIELNSQYIMYFKSQADQSSEIKEFHLQPNCKLYPNPLNKNSDLTIQVSYPNLYSLEIYTNLGKRLYTTQLLNEKNILQMKNMKEGIYFYSIKDNTQVIYNGKLIILD